MKLDGIRVLAIGGLGLLAACGGGGSGGNGNNPPPPVQDTTPPEITVNGETATDLAYASAYEDEGATATDDTDGSVDISVSGSVDTFTPGDYTITYTATDAAGNEATAERVVTVANQTFQLTVSNFGEASISLSSSTPACTSAADICTANIEAGTELTVTAAPENGWTFDSWLNCDTVSANQCTLTMDDDRVVYAASQSDEAVTLKPDVVVLENEMVDALLNYNPASSILSFEAGTDVSSYSAGTILVSQGSAANDIYFAKRIVDIITINRSPVIIETINVPIDEIVESGTIIAATDVNSSTVDSSTLSAGLSVDKASTTAAVDAIPLIAVDVPVYDANGVTASVSGNIIIDFQPHIAADFDIFEGLREFRFAGSASIDADLDLNMSGEVDTPLSFGEELSLGTMTVGTVSAGPLIFLIEIEPFVEVNSALEVTVRPSISVQQVSTLGTQWHMSSGWTNLSDFSFDGAFGIPEPPTANISAEFGGGLKPLAKLYGLAGPFLKAAVYGGGDYTLVAADDCRLTYRHYVGARASAGGEFGRISRRLRYETAPAGIEFALDSGTIDCPADTVAPDIPTGLAVSALSDSELALDWQAPNDNVGVTYYEVWRALSDTGRARRIDTTTSLSYVDTGRSPDTEYCYYVIAVDADGNKSAIPEDFVCGTTDPAADTELPGVPAGFSISDITSSSMALSWTASTDNDAVAGYIVFDETVNTAYGDLPATSSPSFIASPLNPDTEYCYSVAAVDASGNQSTRSQVVCATTEPAANAAWTALLGCVGQEFNIQQNFDLPESGVSPVEFAGAGNDYDGSPLTYVFQGTYNAENGEFQSDIIWAFEGQSDQRIDRFTADLSTGDSGPVAMDQIQVTGCDARIQIVSNEGGDAPVSHATTPARVSASSVGRENSFGGNLR